MEKIKVEIPTWSLSYLVNGDSEGLTGDEIKMIDSFMERNKVEIISPDFDEEGNMDEYFSNYPEFGLPATVCDCTIICR